MGLGSVRDINLASARQQAAECRRLLALGKDPIAERDGERARTLVEKQRSMSFDQCSQAYIAAHRDGWRNAKHAAQWENTLRLHASPVIGKLPVDEVKLRHVLLILEPIWRDRTEIKSLEERLGVRLLTRTTRSVSPTEAGARLIQGLAPRFEEIEAELAAVGEMRDKPAGTIRITTTDHAANTIPWPRFSKVLPEL